MRKRPKKLPTILTDEEREALLKVPNKRYPTALRNYCIMVTILDTGMRAADICNLKLVDILTDPQLSEILKLMRIAVVTRNTLEKLRKKGVDDIDGGIKKLLDNKIIHVFQSENGTEYYALLSDLHISLVYPRYMLSSILHQYDVKSKSEPVLIEYLNVLEDAYRPYKLKTKSKE